MKIFNILLFSLIGMNFVQAQATKVAILDFENTSGKTEYDALSKAISSMLITDLANNIHPKKVEFFERSQLNKLLDEQKLQKSKDFDTKTAVDFGKLSGVNYVFVGTVFVLDGTCNFSTKLVDVQTSKILLAKEVNGTIVNFLQLKSQLAEAIAIQLNNPITLDPSYKEQSTTLSTINQYGKILTTMDQGDADKAEQLRSVFQETTPDFKYFSDIKDEIDELKKQVAQNTADINVLNQSGDLVINASSLEEYENNLKSDLLSKEKKFDVFVNMIKNHADVLISKPLPYGDYGYEINFANQLDFNSLDFIDGQLNILDKLNSENQKILLIKLIRGEISSILWKYEQFFNYGIPQKEIVESKLIETIELYKKCLVLYQTLCSPEISLKEINYLEIIVPYSMIQNSYIEAAFFGYDDTLFFNSPEFKSLQKNLLEDFVTNLTDSYKVDNRITQSLVSYYKQEGISFYYGYFLLFIYFNEINKSTNKLDKVIAINATVRTLKNLVSGDNMMEEAFQKLSMPLIIDETGVSFNDNLNKLEVKIGNQIWMTKNLNVDQFQNGDKIRQVNTFEEWEKFIQQGEPAWCYYNFNENNSQECGKIYNWFAVIDKRLIAPKGWHIPTSSEWDKLSSQAPSLYECAAKLRKQGAWEDNFLRPSTNESGFSDMPSGKISDGIKWGDGIYNFENNQASFWWTSTWSPKYSEVISNSVKYDLRSSAEIIILEDLFTNNSTRINEGMFVRCVKN